MVRENKRKIRLIISFTAALLLAAALVYVSFTASSQAKSPSEVIAAGAATAGTSYEVFGVVVDGSVQRDGETLKFELADRDDPNSTIAVTYTGTIPDPFREGREVIVTGELKDGVFVAQRDSLITKCPSKFEEEDGSQSAS